MPKLLSNNSYRWIALEEGRILKFCLLKWKVYVDKDRLSDGRNLGECVSVGLSSVTSEEKILFRHGGTWIRARMRNKPAIIPMLQRLLHPSETISRVSGDWQANVLGGRKPKNSGVAARRIIPNEPGTISDALVDALPAYMYAVRSFTFLLVGSLPSVIFVLGIPCGPPIHIRDVSVVFWRKFKISRKQRILSKTNDSDTDSGSSTNRGRENSQTLAETDICVGDLNGERL